MASTTAGTWQASTAQVATLERRSVDGRDCMGCTGVKGFGIGSQESADTEYPVLSTRYLLTLDSYLLGNHVLGVDAGGVVGVAGLFDGLGSETNDAHVDVLAAGLRHL